AWDVPAAPRAPAGGPRPTPPATRGGAGAPARPPPPVFAATDALRVYPVQPSTTPPAPAQRPQKVFEQVVIPQQAGAVTLPSLRLSFFDPEARAYRTIQAPPIALAVRPSAAAHASPQAVRAAPAARRESLGRDIVFIKASPGTLVAAGARRWRSPVFWAAQALPLAAWLAAVLYDRRRRRLSGDVRWARFTRAGREARQAIG